MQARYNAYDNEHYMNTHDVHGHSLLIYRVFCCKLPAFSELPAFSVAAQELAAALRSINPAITDAEVEESLSSVAGGAVPGAPHRPTCSQPPLTRPALCVARSDVTCRRSGAGIFLN
jgi:hypothetical protein